MNWLETEEGKRWWSEYTRAHGHEPGQGNDETVEEAVANRLLGQTLAEAGTPPTERDWRRMYFERKYGDDGYFQPFLEMARFALSPAFAPGTGVAPGTGQPLEENPPGWDAVDQAAADTAIGPGYTPPTPSDDLTNPVRSTTSTSGTNNRAGQGGYVYDDSQVASGGGIGASGPSQNISDGQIDSVFDPDYFASMQSVGSYGSDALTNPAGSRGTPLAGLQSDAGAGAGGWSPPRAGTGLAEGAGAIAGAAANAGLRAGTGFAEGAGWSPTPPAGTTGSVASSAASFPQWGDDMYAPAGRVPNMAPIAPQSPFTLRGIDNRLARRWQDVSDATAAGLNRAASSAGWVQDLNAPITTHLNRSADYYVNTQLPGTRDNVWRANRFATNALNNTANTIGRAWRFLNDPDYRRR